MYHLYKKLLTLTQELVIIVVLLFVRIAKAAKDDLSNLIYSKWRIK
jgi:hypothetical protein